jgi:choline-glycine betaine transporter
VDYHEGILGKVKYKDWHDGGVDKTKDLVVDILEVVARVKVIIVSLVVTKIFGEEGLEVLRWLD